METEQLNFRALLDLMKSASIADVIGAKDLKENILSIANNLSRQHLEDSKTLPFFASQEDQG